MRSNRSWPLLTWRLREVSMFDLVYLALGVGAFALFGLYAAALKRI